MQQQQFDQQQGAQENLTPEQAREQLAQMKEMVQLSDDMDTLKENPLFKRIFTERYMVDEAERYTALLASSTSSTSRINIETLHARLMGISCFRDYVIGIKQMAEQAQISIDALEKTLAEHEAGDSDTEADDE